jgi:hypothetical protein
MTDSLNFPGRKSQRKFKMTIAEARAILMQNKRQSTDKDYALAWLGDIIE